MIDINRETLLIEIARDINNELKLRNIDAKLDTDINFEKQKFISRILCSDGSVLYSSSNSDMRKAYIEVHNFLKGNEDIKEQTQPQS